jgi:hypothetical protein
MDTDYLPRSFADYTMNITRKRSHFHFGSFFPRPGGSGCGESERGEAKGRFESTTGSGESEEIQVSQYSINYIMAPPITLIGPPRKKCDTIRENIFREGARGTTGAPCYDGSMRITRRASALLLALATILCVHELVRRPLDRALSPSSGRSLSVRGEAKRQLMFERARLDALLRAQNALWNNDPFGLPPGSHPSLRSEFSSLGFSCYRESPITPTPYVDRAELSRRTEASRRAIARLERLTSRL